ncbi:hypothetical protein LDENG_00245930 [Lucifuga dentata]|nr:hypothetical protein LDENG_00245930 [Lucifuga dentata]
MEDFTCWWHPLDNVTKEEEVTYILIYSKDRGPKYECPDYVSAGVNSCHFDSHHTSIWKIYCMNVTAVTANRNYTSQEHCLDVAEIVQTEAPVNLSYWLTDACGDEMGHNAWLSWTYPVPSDLQFGWITLVYELQYRRVSEHNSWKVKHPLRESHVELLGLPVGDYVVRVRCRSHSYGLWSKWSSTLLLSVPASPLAGKLLVLILVTGVSVMALLVIAFGIILQSKRIKDYFLPPIPKPRITGIDPLLLKKGNVDEINRHLSSFHSYSPPIYAKEVWDQVSANDVCLTSPKDCSISADPTDRKQDSLMVTSHPPPPAAAAHHLTASRIQSFVPYCSLPPEPFAVSGDVPSPCVRPEIMSLPGTDYSVMGHPGLPVPPPEAAASCPPQEFYNCVQLMNKSGEVCLVPCLPPAHGQYFPPHERAESDGSNNLEVRNMMAEWQDKRNVGATDESSEAVRSEAAVPLLPVTVDNRN